MGHTAGTATFAELILAKNRPQSQQRQACGICHQPVLLTKPQPTDDHGRPVHVTCLVDHYYKDAA